MQTTGNTILITGGGTGIGRGLAEALHARGNTVIIAGRRASVLAEVADRHSGMRGIECDVSDGTKITGFATRVVADLPALNVLINCAGIQENEGMKPVIDEDLLMRTVAINLLGPIRLTSALLPGSAATQTCD